MATNTKIEWCDATWNALRGCSVISPGCVNCYAMKQAHRFSGKGKSYEGLTKQTKAGPQWTGKVVLAEKQLLDPLKWRTPKRVFVNSMADLFHESVPDESIDRIFAVMALCDGEHTRLRPAPKGQHMTSAHTFQILTKRAERMRGYMTDVDTPFRIAAEVCKMAVGFRPWKGMCDWRAWDKWPLPNVWLGVSVENQQYANERIPALLETPAAIRFVSAEPLLGPVDFTLRGRNIADWDEDWHYNVLTGKEWASPRDDDPERSQHIDWVIVGGESGNGARYFDTSQARSIVKQCTDAGVACFVKQLGAKPEQPVPGAWNTAQRELMKLRDRKGGDITEWPPDLRVREFPEVRA